MTDRGTIKDRVVRVAADVSGNQLVHKITHVDNVSLSSDLALDGNCREALHVHLEREFDAALVLAEVEECDTLGELIRLVDRRIAERESLTDLAKTE